MWDMLIRDAALVALGLCTGSRGHSALTRRKLLIRAPASRMENVKVVNTEVFKNPRFVATWQPQTTSTAQQTTEALDKLDTILTDWADTRKSFPP